MESTSPRANDPVQNASAGARTGFANNWAERAATSSATLERIANETRRSETLESDSEDVNHNSSATRRGNPGSFEHLARVPLQNLPGFFDAFEIDLHPIRGAKKSKAAVPPFIVEMSSQGNPDSKDIRGRVLTVTRNPEAEESAVARAVKSKASVYRISYNCRGYKGHCSSNEKPCDMVLRVEIKADDISAAVISVQNLHDPPPDGEKRKSSMSLRQRAFDFFLLGRTTPAQFHFEFQSQLGDNVPVDRLLTIPQLKSIAKQARKTKFGPVSYSVLRELAKDRPDHVMVLGAPTDSNGQVTLGSSFLCCWTDDIGLEWAISKGHLGICGVDSSWRNKSKSNAPLTAFVAFDRITRRGLPLGMMFSAGVDQVSIERFIRWLVDAVKTYAARLQTLDRAQWPATLRPFADRVQACAEGKWRPRVVTLDKSRAEFNALKAVWPEVILRLCFWHIANAILKWQGEKGDVARDEGELGEARARDSIIPRSVRKALIPVLFAVFRAPTAAEYQQAKQELFDTGIARVVEVAAADRAEVARIQLVAAIKRYLSRNWLDSEVWIPTFASFCLPDDIDLSWVNTNNYVEALWKLIDRVILRGRFHIAVALLLLQRVWVYISRQDETPRLSRANREAMAAGAVLWESGSVRAVADDVSGRLFEVLRADKSLARVDADALRQPCSIPACKLLANPCKHYFAADLFRCNGPYQRWQQAASQGTRSAASSQATRDEESSSSSDSDESEGEEIGGASQLDPDLLAPAVFTQESALGGESDSGLIVNSAGVGEGTQLSAANVSSSPILGPEPQPSNSQTLEEASQSTLARGNIEFSIRPWTAGLTLKSWPLPVARASEINFNKRSLTSADRDEQPMAKRRGRTGNVEPTRPTEADLAATDSVLPPKGAGFSWAEPIGAMFPALIGACEAPRLKDPLPIGLRRIVELNKSADTFGRVLAWFDHGSPLPTAVRVYLRDMYAAIALRELKGSAAPTFLEALQAMFDPKDASTHRTVTVISPCCSFSHKSVKLPPIFDISRTVVEQLLARSGGLLPISKVLLASIPWSTPGFRQRKCSAEADTGEGRGSPATQCSGPPTVAFGNRGLNRVVSTVTFGPGSWSLDLEPEFDIRAPDCVTSHRLLAVVYGLQSSSGATSLFTRTIQPDGALVEHDETISGGRFRPVLDGSGNNAANWAALTAKERWEVRGRRPVVAIYVMKGTSANV